MYYSFTYLAISENHTHHSQPRLDFSPITLSDIPAINRTLRKSTSRTCDYTIGGIYMWADYFKYEHCLIGDTLFMKGLTENDRLTTAFSLPIGAMPIRKAVELIEEYCAAHGLCPRFSAIPEEQVWRLIAGHRSSVEPLTDWADYIYDANELATLTGKKFNKKRNHVNHFLAEHPEAALLPLTTGIIPEVMDFIMRLEHDNSDTARAELAQVVKVLDNYAAYPFEGAVLRLSPRGPIAAFTVGEVIGDTLYLHIEKMDHDITGAGETINKLFAADMTARHGIAYINREEDCGDPGLRKAKLSYNPVFTLNKYNVILD